MTTTSFDAVLLDLGALVATIAAHTQAAVERSPARGDVAELVA